ncbi:MAG: hypothetical protein HY782_12100 [Chloroflexi bacterium]|nr:hypothetical protein [Chloroflexota bacterium]
MTRNNRNRKLILVFFILAFAIISMAGIFTAAEAQSGSGYYFDIRSIYTRPFGVTNPVGLAFPSASSNFVVIDAPKAGQANVALALVPFREEPITAARPFAIADPINLAYSERTKKFWLYERATSSLTSRAAQADGALAAQAADRFDGRSLGLSNPQGMTFDPKSGQAFILDAAARRIVRIAADGQGNPNPASAARVVRIDLGALGAAQLRGIAFNPQNGHLYVMDVNGPKLYELTVTGALVATRNLADLRIRSSQGMTFAPSVDQTDAAATMNLYLADAGSGAVGGRIVELSLDAPRVATARVAAAAAATLVQTINTWQWSPPAPDPAGIVYDPATGRLLMTDSEVDEIPQLFTGKNVFELNLNGNLVDTYSTMDFSNEPTGVAINSDGHWFFSKDGSNQITDLDPGPDENFGTNDDTWRRYSISGFGVQDAEDLAIGAGKMYIADGKNQEVWVISKGNNGIFDGPPSVGGDDTATHFDTSTLGVRDPEGIAYDAATGNLWICSRRSPVVEVTTNGVLVRSIDIAFLNPIDPDGITVAPGSNNAAEMHLYIADRMVDNNQDPNENDGRIYELDVDSNPPPDPTPTNTPPPGQGQRIKDITFEDGSLTHPTSGADTTSGTVQLDSTSLIKGVYSAVIPNAASSYLNENFTGVSDVYVSFYFKLNAVPGSNVRIAFVSTAGTIRGNLLLRTNGSLRLRDSGTTIGADSAPLTAGTIYRIGLRQKVGTGSNGVLEAYLAVGDNAFGAPFAATTAGTWTSQADRFRFGATTANNLNAVFDDILIDSGAMPPPSP